MQIFSSCQQKALVGNFVGKRMLENVAIPMGIIRLSFYRVMTEEFARNEIFERIAQAVSTRLSRHETNE